MKRFTIASLPLNSATIRAQVFQTPPYNFIEYQDTLNGHFYAGEPTGAVISCKHPANSESRDNDIRFYLTKPHQYVLNYYSLRLYTSF